MRNLFVIAGVVFLFQFVMDVSAQSAIRAELFATSDPGVKIHVREVQQRGSTGQPILLVHGARVPGIGSFDLPVKGGSLAEDFAAMGFRVYLMDVRGYGLSSRPAAMSEDASKNPPLVRSSDAVKDIDAAIELVRKKTGARKVALMGWATGGQWAGHYSSLHSEKLSALIMLNALYSGNSAQPLVGHGSDLEDKEHPGRVNTSVGAWRCNPASSLTGGWERSIPMEDKGAWRDPEVAKAYTDAALASDPESGRHTPPCFRSPNGAMEDSFYLATGRQLWDASMITAPTMFVAGERDFWSRPEDRERLQAHLVHSPKVKVVVIAGATHFVHLDRDERGRTQLMNEVASFLGQQKEE